MVPLHPLISEISITQDLRSRLRNWTRGPSAMISVLVDEILAEKAAGLTTAQIKINYKAEVEAIFKYTMGFHKMTEAKSLNKIFSDKIQRLKNKKNL